MRIDVLSDSCRVNGASGEAVESTPLDARREAVMEGAKNEYLSFQLVLSGVDAPLEAIDLSFEGQGAAFELIRFTVYYEWFHDCDGKLIPDMLIPWETTDRTAISKRAAEYYASACHVFWIDCFLPGELPTGVCEGALKIAWGGQRESVPIRIDVKSVSLCNESLIIADLNNYADNLSGLFPGMRENDRRFEDGSYFAAERPFYRLAHEHRAVFHLLPYTHSGFVYKSFAPVTEGQGAHIRVTDWSLYDAHYGPYFDGSAFAGSERGPIPTPYAYLPFCFDWPASYEKFGEPGYRMENRRVLLEFIRHFEEKGWTRTAFELFLNHKKRYRFYPYDGDELRHQHDEELTYIYGDIFTNILDLSDVNILLRTDASWSFGRHYDSPLSKIVKMWTVGGGLLQFYPESYKHMKGQGNILWAYGGIPSMDMDLTCLFEWPMRCLANDLGGLLFWNTTGVGDDFLRCPHAGGSETFFYPAYPFDGAAGVFPSLRLKFLRNAMQVADLVKMHEGTWTFHEMRDSINALYGISAEEWHSPLPDILDTPPHEITNERIYEACQTANRPSRNATPALPGAVKKKILEKAAAFVGGQSVWR